MTWNVSTLQAPYTFNINMSDTSRGLQPFYALHAFNIQSSASLDVPEYMLVSQSYHKQLWALSPHEFRRLKDITVILEWVPDAAALTPITQHDLTPMQRTRITRIFHLFDADGDGVLNRAEMRVLLQVLGKRCGERDVERWISPYIDIPTTTTSTSTDATSPTSELTLNETSFTQLIRSFTVADINKDMFAKTRATTSTATSTRAMEQAGRYFVIIPLVEAETLRR